MLQEPDIKKLIQYCKDHNISYMGVFGSVAKNEKTENSDIDILIRFEQPVGLIRLSATQRELSQLLDCEVDLVTEKSLSPYLKDEVLNSTRVIYDKAG